MNMSDSSDMDLSQEINKKVEDFLKEINAELLKGADREEFAKTKRNATRNAKHDVTKMNQNIINSAQIIDNNNQYLEEWIKTNTDNINEITKNEIQSLEALQKSQQEIFQAQLTEKGDLWEKEVLQRREEAAQLKNMITHLESLISIAKNETKADIEIAQKSASKKIQTSKKYIQKQLQLITDLSEQIEKENRNFEITVKQINQTNSNASQQKKDQLSRLQLVVKQLQSKLKEKERSNDLQFRQQVKIIKELRLELQKSREVEKEKLDELQKLRRTQSSISRKISAQKDESSSLQHQLSLCLEDNEELQADIVKIQNKMFPEIFNDKVM